MNNHIYSIQTERPGPFSEQPLGRHLNLANPLANSYCGDKVNGKEQDWAHQLHRVLSQQSTSPTMVSAPSYMSKQMRAVEMADSHHQNTRGTNSNRAFENSSKGAWGAGDLSLSVSYL